MASARTSKVAAAARACSSQVRWSAGSPASLVTRVIRCRRFPASRAASEVTSAMSACRVGKATVIGSSSDSSSREVALVEVAEVLADHDQVDRFGRGPEAAAVLELRERVDGVQLRPRGRTPGARVVDEAVAGGPRQDRPAPVEDAAAEAHDVGGQRGSAGGERPLAGRRPSSTAGVAGGEAAVSMSSAWEVSSGPQPSPGSTPIRGAAEPRCAFGWFIFPRAGAEGAGVAVRLSSGGGQSRRFDGCPGRESEVPT